MTTCDAELRVGAYCPPVPEATAEWQAEVYTCSLPEGHDGDHMQGGRVRWDQGITSVGAGVTS